MTYSRLASTQGNSPKKSGREGSAVTALLIHHMASTDGPGTTNMMLGAGGRTVSANYTIWSDGSIHGVVPEEYRAWTSGASGDGGKGAAWDRRSITVEIANESGEPDWRISQKALQAAADLLGDLRARYNIQEVLGHRDLYTRYGASYPTYCPGPDTVSRILALSPTQGGGGSTPSPAPSPAPDHDQSEEDDIMRIKNIDTGQIYNVSPEFIAHVDGGDGENKAWDDAGLPGFIEVKTWSFNRILRQLGIPGNVLNRKGYVLDDLNGQGKYVKNGVWSRAQKVERLAYLAQK